MKAIIVNYRLARHHHYENQMIIQIPDVDSKEKAKELVGKTVVWTSPAKKEIKGRISNPHGNKGVVRALFETGMPGQAIGSEVTIR